MSDLEKRLETLIERLHTVYDGIGHSSGRPYVYFVYPPDQERTVRRLVDENLRDDGIIHYEHIDVLPITIESLEGQEERRRELLEDPDPVKGDGASDSIVRLWARNLSRAIADRLSAGDWDGRPVVVLRGLAALHPLGDPSSLMEALAEQEPRDPETDRIVPLILLVPGVRPPQTSRTYLFLGREDLRREFYRGEEA